MTIRNFQDLFRPGSVALLGASDRAGSVGAVLARNLLAGGMQGPVYLINPHHRRIARQRAWSNIGDLPDCPDLAVIATPPESVPGLVRACAERGTKGIVVITAGSLAAGHASAVELRQDILNEARPQLTRVVGPNCLGLLVPGHGLNASFAHMQPLPGKLAFIAQSGAVLSSVIDWATPRGIGFSHLVSLGDMADVDFGDMLDYLAADPDTHAILLYIESVTSARKFMSAARAAARQKPVVAVKAGRFADSARAAHSHTGAMAGADGVYAAAFARAGIVRAAGLEGLFDAAEILAMHGAPIEQALTIVTNGGGMGVMAADALLEQGGRLAELSPQTLARLDEVLPENWSHGNPVDIIGDADSERYQRALEVLLASPEAGALLVLNCPTGVASNVDSARAVAQTVGGDNRRTVLTSWLGEATGALARKEFTQAGIASYPMPEQAVTALMHMVRYRQTQEMLLETPPSVAEHFAPDVKTARDTVRAALEDGREWLHDDELKDVLRAYDLPVVESWSVADAQGAARAAARCDGPVVLKLRTREATHKSRIGGVRLNLQGAAEVRAAASRMLEAVAADHPDLAVDGLLVQPMVSTAGAVELILGLTDDPTFGPMVLFGHGGTAAEALADSALAMPPLNLHLAEQLIRQTRVSRLLRDEDSPLALDRHAVALSLVKLAQLAIDVPEIRELDINPLLVHRHGAVLVDARCRIAPAPAQAGARLAIRPYPQELERDIALQDGGRLWLRPIRPEDETAMQVAFAKLPVEDVRQRFHHYLKRLPHRFSARLSQIDYDREMALVLVDHGPPGQAEMYGVVRIVADPDNETAEFALIVRGDLRGQGVGRRMLREILEHAQRRGIREVYGTILNDNRPMLGLCRSMGFEVGREPDSPGVMRARFDLAAGRGS